ncbi:MAG: ATP phosphoribosyltransferase [Bacteroidota bacterium]
MDNNRLRIAIQKSGRLSEKTNALLNECGIKYSTNKRTLMASASTFPLDLLLLRDDDIPQYVEDGVAHIGILGENVVAETNKSVAIIKRLGFSRCRMSLAIPKDTDYTDLTFFEGKEIATSYPVVLQKYLDEAGVKAAIHEISGSVEIAPNIGLADGIFDIVSTGGTLRSNGLREVEILMQSEAVLIGNNHLNDTQQAILDDLLFRMDAVMNAKNKKYVLLNAPYAKVDEIIALLPGVKSPTVMQLAAEGWVAIHAVLKEEDYWQVVRPLKELGAEDILVMPIERIIA